MAVAAKTSDLRETLQVGPLEVMPEEHLARAGGRALMLSIRELRLLTELARRADRIMAREELFSLVWGREMRSGDRSVDVYVRKAAGEARVGALGLELHPHPLRIRVPLAAERRQHANDSFTTD
ncbi:MAG: winged helix-turn-helix domain-containing protein [Solirubrobacteraceae bacterium]